MSHDLLVGSSPLIAAIHAQVQRLLSRPGARGRLAPILILGETGTGKGLLVRVLHRASARCDMPLVEINCAAIPETLVEAELFGYERGAFTDARQAKTGLFQAAHGGVLFLDEVGALPLPVQAKLLTALEQREVRRLGGTRVEPIDVWIVSATNENLAQRVAQREFRLDLYHRISAHTLQMPPLRDRGRDVLELASHFLERFSSDYGLSTRRLTAGAEVALMAHAWPGNVRELANVIERAVLLADTDKIGPELLQLHPPSRSHEATTGTLAQLPATDPEVLQAALEATQWNLSRAAARLGVPRNTLRYRIERLRLRPSETSGTGMTAGVSAVSAAGDMAPAPLRWERRWITSLLVRLEPPPSLGAFRLTSLVESLTQKVESFGGHLEELHPLGFTALFGHEPMEDAPSSAALAAQAVQKAVVGEREVDGGRVALTVVLHVTENLIARRAPASDMDLEDRQRLRRALGALAAAPTAAIVVSSEAARFLERRFTLEPLRDHPQNAYRLIGPSRSNFDVGGRARSAFVDRVREMSQLDDLLGEVEQGRGQLVGVVAEPGTGKSRLLHEFHQGIGHERVTYLEGRCSTRGSDTPYLPIVHLLRQAFALSDGDDPAAVARKIREGVDALKLPAAAIAPYLLHVVGAKGIAAEELARLTPAAVRRRTLDALRQVIIAASQQRPMILAVEDLQWADATSADSLMALADSAAACRILMVMTYRHGYQPPWLGKSYATQLVLHRLSAPDSLRIVESIASAETVPRHVADALVAKAGGIPFFLEELVRTVADGPADTELSDIPGTIQGVIAARLDHLTLVDRELLEAAAVLGKEGSVSLLREVSGLAEPEFSSALRRLRAAEFLRETRVVPFPEYAFTHVLTQEAAYQSLAPERRRVLHRAAAAALQALPPHTVDVMAEVLARHLTEAGMVAAGIAQWHRAGRLAIERSANAEAVVHFRRALEMLRSQADNAERAQREVMVLLLLVTALSATRGYAAAEIEEALTRARDLVEGMEESPQTWLLRWNLWRFYIARADFRTSEDLVDRLEAAAERLGDEGLTLNASIAAGVTAFYRGAFEQALDHLQRAARLFREANLQQIATYGQDVGIAGRGFLAWTLAVTGALDEAAREADTALELARGVNHPFTLALILLAAAEVYQLRREPEVVEPLGRELLELSREHSFVFFIAFGLMFSGWARAASGDAPAGLAMMQEGAELSRSVGHRLGLAQRTHLAEGLIAQGALDEGLGVVADALSQSEETGEHAFVAELQRVRGEGLKGQGRFEEARACLRSALALAMRQGAWLFALRAACDLARLGAPDAADLEALRAILDRFPSGPDTSDLKAARALLWRNTR